MQLANFILLSIVSGTTAFSKLARPIINTARLAMIPENIILDIVAFTNDADTPVCKMDESADFGKLLKSHKKAVVFAVPGAFTPTCSVQHLPGFITNMDALKAKGVEAVYCISVNDKYVMRSWAEATSGCVTSGVKLVADGNCEFTQALGMVKDASGSRMGLRSKRFAALIVDGEIKAMNVDEKGLVNSSAEKILELL